MSYKHMLHHENTFLYRVDSLYLCKLTSVNDFHLIPYSNLSPVVPVIYGRGFRRSRPVQECKTRGGYNLDI